VCKGKRRKKFRLQKISTSGFCADQLVHLTFAILYLSIPREKIFTLNAFILTVMGPDGMAPREKLASIPSTYVRRSLEDAPPLVPGQDRQKWHRDVFSWATFSYVLYDAVHHSYQKVLDHAKDSGSLNSDGQNTPSEIIDRLLSAYQHVHTCVRHEKDQQWKYATRFRGLEFEYMSLAGVSATEQESSLWQW